MLSAGSVHAALSRSGGWTGSVSGFSRGTEPTEHLYLCILSVYVFTSSLYMYLYKKIYFKELAYAIVRSDQISRSVVSNSFRPHESQHARPPCPSPTPGVHSDSCPSSQ